MVEWHPHLLFQVKDSWLDVHLCQGGTPGCGVSNSTNSNSTNPAGILKFPKRSKEETVIRILTRLSGFDFVSFIFSSGDVMGTSASHHFYTLKHWDCFRTLLENFQIIYNLILNFILPLYYNFILLLVPKFKTLHCPLPTVQSHILTIEGCQSDSILIDARSLLRIQWQGMLPQLSITYHPCMDMGTQIFYSNRRGKKNSGTVWSGIQAFGVVWRITLRATYTTTCIGMKSPIGSQNLPRLQKRIIPHSEACHSVHLCLHYKSEEKEESPEMLQS